MTTPPAAYDDFASYDTGWMDLPYATTSGVANFADYAAGTGPQGRRIGHLVELVGQVKPANAATVTAMGTGAGAIVLVLPADLLPATAIARAYVSQGSSSARWACNINPATGEVFANRFAGTTLGTSTWLPFSFTYFAKDPA